MRELSDPPARLDHHCTLGLMAAAGLAVGCGLAAYGPMLAIDVPVAAHEPAWLARAGSDLVLACAATWGFACAVRRPDGATAAASAAQRMLFLAAAAWAVASAFHAGHASEAAWLAQQGLASIVCGLMLCVFLGEEVDVRFARWPGVACAVLVAMLGPMGWWADAGLASAGDLRMTAAVQGVELAMLAVAALHQGMGRSRTRKVAAAGAWMAWALILQWIDVLGRLGERWTLDAWLFHAGLGALALMGWARNVQGPEVAGPHESSRIGEAVDGASASAMSAARQRMVS